MNTAFCGKRINQNSIKLKQIQGRERRLNKIGLSLHSFSQKQNWMFYFTQRNHARPPVIDTVQEGPANATDNPQL